MRTRSFLIGLALLISVPAIAADLNPCEVLTIADVRALLVARRTGDC